MENVYYYLSVGIIVLLAIMCYLLFTYIPKGYVGITPTKVYKQGIHYMIKCAIPDYYQSPTNKCFNKFKNLFVIRIEGFYGKTLYISYSYKEGFNLEKYDIKTAGLSKYKTPFEKILCDLFDWKYKYLAPTMPYIRGGELIENSSVFEVKLQKDSINPITPLEEVKNILENSKEFTFVDVKYRIKDVQIHQRKPNQKEKSDVNFINTSIIKESLN